MTAASKKSKRPWDITKNHKIGELKVAAPSALKRVEGCWIARSSAYHDVALSFADADYGNDPQTSLSEAVALLRDDTISPDESIERVWARHQSFPEFTIQWSVRRGLVVSELVVTLFRFKHGSIEVPKTINYVISTSERMTQRQLNIVCEGAFMAWLNYLATHSTVEKKHLPMTDFTRGSQRWRSVAEQSEALFPRAKDYPKPVTLTV